MTTASNMQANAPRGITFILERPANMPDSNTPARPTTSETIDVLLDRRSIRKYAPEPVSDAHVSAILEAAVRAPTSSNIHAYSIIVVRDAETKRRLAVPAGNQQHIVDCPVFLAFCADLTRMDKALGMYGDDLSDNNLEMGLVSSIDAALVGMSAYVAADSLGIKGVMIGAMRNDPAAVAEILGLPQQVYVVFGMCLGFPAEVPKQKPRMPLDGLVHHECYDVARALAAVDAYDPALAAHYESIGKATTPASWSDEIGKKFSPQPRAGLRAALKARGFDFL